MTQMHPPVRPRRVITGMSAVLLPFTADGAIDWPGFEAHLARTTAAGLVPAVNMDTGFGPVLDPGDRTRALRIAAEQVTGQWVAGAHVVDVPGAAYDDGEYAAAVHRDRRCRWAPDPVSLPRTRDVGRRRRRVRS